MTSPSPVEALGSIFVDPDAHADPEGWHASAARIRCERPILRMEVRAIFSELLGRLERVELDGEPTWIRSHFLQGPKHIPIRYELC